MKAIVTRNTKQGQHFNKLIVYVHGIVYTPLPCNGRLIPTLDWFHSRISIDFCQRLCNSNKWNVYRHVFSMLMFRYWIYLSIRPTYLYKQKAITLIRIGFEPNIKYIAYLRVASDLPSTNWQGWQGAAPPVHLTITLYAYSGWVKRTSSVKY